MGHENGKANGAGTYADELHSGKPPSGPLPPPPGPVAELVAACNRFVATRYKVALDGTPLTLSLLDQYVRDAREAMKERPESIDLVAPAVGAYLGEVMRQTFGAAWSLPAQEINADHDAWRLCFTHVFLAFNPLGLARESLTMTDSEGWNSHLTLDPGEADEIRFLKGRLKFGGAKNCAPFPSMLIIFRRSSSDTGCKACGTNWDCKRKRAVISS